MANGDNLYRYTKTIRPLYRGTGDPINLLTEEELAQRYGSQPAISTKVQTEQNPELAAGTIKYEPYEWKYLPADVGTVGTTVLQGRLFPTEREIAIGRGGWKGRSSLLATGAAMGLVGEVTGEIGGKLLGKGINKINSLYNAGRTIRDPGYRLKSLIAEANKTTDPIKKKELQNLIFNEYHQDTQNFITMKEKGELNKRLSMTDKIIEDESLIKKTSPRKNIIDIQKQLQNKEVTELFPSESENKDLLLQFRELEPSEYFYKNRQQFIDDLNPKKSLHFHNRLLYHYGNGNIPPYYYGRDEIPPYLLGPNATLFDLSTFRYKRLKY